MRKEELLNTSLAELKAYARSIGVNKSTSTKKAELVDKIIQVESGVLKPTFTNKGRKPYATNYVFNTSTEQSIEEKLKKIDELFEEFKSKLVKLLNN